MSKIPIVYFQLKLNFKFLSNPSLSRSFHFNSFIILTIDRYKETIRCLFEVAISSLGLLASQNSVQEGCRRVLYMNNEQFHNKFPVRFNSTLVRVRKWCEYLLKIEIVSCSRTRKKVHVEWWMVWCACGTHFKWPVDSLFYRVIR